MERSIALLERLTQADSVPGFEDEVSAILAERLTPVGTITRDRMGGIVCRRKGHSERPHVMLDCHLDEVGFIIQHVTPGGFLKFLPLGGWWNHVLPAQRVRVHGSGGTVLGVVGSTPPHFLPADRRNQVLDTKDMFIDIGASSREEAHDWGIRPGAWAVPYSPFTRLRNDKLLLSKAFDNRVGCGVCIETIEAIDRHPNTLFACGSVQEEVGLRGAQATAAIADPDVAIVLEGPPADDTPGFNLDESQGAIGGGVQIRAYDPSMIANPRLVEFTIETAKAADIPHQLTVRSAGGTDGGRIHNFGRGVPTVVLGVPARYIHAHTSVISIDDYVAARRLAIELVRNLDQARVDSF
jgi:endoglucanase